MTSPIPAPRSSQLYFAENFVISAGCILFASPLFPLRICLIHDAERNLWLIPKGRKDLSETPLATALRETFEETGYPCSALEVDMITRAPQPDLNLVDAPRMANKAIEPIAIVVRDYAAPGGPKNVKVVWYYVAQQSGEKQLGTQMSTENYRSEFFEVEKACELVAFDGDKDIIRRAAEIVKATYETSPAP
jgi:8-oxo-dGTP pyrophosphatase MutT (NUDIX family)